MNDVIVDWSNTKEALEKLVSLFKCVSCKCILKEPCSFDICNHYFCKQCALQLVNNALKCPQCDAVLWKEHMQISLKIPEVLSICSKLKSLINCNDSGTEVVEAEKEDEEEGEEEIEEEEERGQEQGEKKAEQEESEGQNTEYAHGGETYQFQPMEEASSKSSDEMELKHNDGDKERPVKPNQQSDLELDDEEENQEEEMAETFFVDEDEFPSKKSLNETHTADIHAPLLFSRNTEVEEMETEIQEDFISPPKSQFSNCLTENEVKQGIQQNPRRVLKKPKFTYSKKHSINTDRKDIPNKKETLTLIEPSVSDAPGAPDGEFSVFDFSSGQCLKKEQLEKNTILKSANHGRRRKKVKLNLPEQRRNSKASGSIQHPEMETDKNIEKPNNLGKKKQVKNLEKRNTKGETPLHAACIKGKYEKAKELLQLGAEPNTKDYAGWTPLHEACNHGREEIVELLLDHGAIIDIVAGEDNDTPLHDATLNKHVNVVKSLLQRGAPANIRNRAGLLPIDYATSSEMKNLFKEIDMLQLDTSACDVTMYDEASSNKPKIFLTTNLSNAEKQQVKKCYRDIGGTEVSEFDETVSHVICGVNEHGLSKARTLKYLFGLLTGKWLVSFKWVQVCMSSKEWISEIEYELKGTSDTSSDAPRKSRINAYKKQPKLFDGCSFYFSGLFDNSLPKESLVQLAKVGGGKILMREPKTSDIDPLITPLSPAVSKLNLLPKHYKPKVIYHAMETSAQTCCAEYIIYDPKKSPGHKKVSSPVLCTAPVSWLLDCISSFQVVDVRDEHDTKVGLKSSQM